MKKLLSAIRSFTAFSKGFTLIELLVVIAILGVLAAGVLIAVNPAERITQAKDTQVMDQISKIGLAIEIYGVTHNGFYPADQATLVPSELKSKIYPPAGYDPNDDYDWYTEVGGVASACVSGVNCSRILIQVQLKSNKFTSLSPNAVLMRYDTLTGKACPVAQGGGGTCLNY